MSGTLLLVGAFMSGFLGPALVLVGYTRHSNEYKIKNDPKYEQTWMDKHIRANLIHAIWIMGAVIFLVGLLLAVYLPFWGRDTCPIIKGVKGRKAAAAARTSAVKNDKSDTKSEASRMSMNSDADSVTSEEKP